MIGGHAAALRFLRLFFAYRPGIPRNDTPCLAPGAPVVEGREA